MTLEVPLVGTSLTTAIPAEMSSLYRAFSGHDRTTATTYITDNVVACVLNNILTTNEPRLVKFRGAQAVLDGRVAFQTNTEDRFTAAIEKLTGRRMVAF